MKPSVVYFQKKKNSTEFCFLIIIIIVYVFWFEECLNCLDNETKALTLFFISLTFRLLFKVQSKWFGVKMMVEAPVAAEARAIKCVEDT